VANFIFAITATGTIRSDNTIVGDWSDVTRGATLNSGTLAIRISSSGGVTQLTKIVVTGASTAMILDLKFHSVVMLINSSRSPVTRSTVRTLPTPGA
jgi:hypothetical protein